MKKKIKLGLGLLGSIAAVGAVAGGVTAGLNNNSATSSVATDSNASGSNTNVFGENTNKGEATVIESIQTTSKNEGFTFKLEKSSSDSTVQSYLLTIEGNTKKEGVIYLVGENGEESNQLMVTPGQTFQVGVHLNEGYEDYTVRDLKVFGASENHFVPSKEVEGKTNFFEVTLPTIEESTYMDGTNWMYAENTPIKVVPSFIVKSIGNEVNWEHGAYFGDLNGYVYELKQDSKWSEIKEDLYKNAFVNEDINDPITIYFFLNGHTLTIDEKVEEALGVKSGWSLQFYNNSTDSKDATNGWGEIVSSIEDGFEIDVKGSVAFGRGVKFNYMEWGNGIKILNDNSPWIGTISWNPNK